MRLGTVTLVSLTLLINNAFAAVPDGVISDLSNAREFKVFKKTRDLPTQIKTSLAKAFKESTLEMADAGNPFQKTDFGIQRPKARVLPSRRLIFAFGTSRYFVVYYESSAVGLGANALVFRIDTSGSANLVWGGVEKDYGNLAKNPTRLINRLRERKLIDDQKFIW